jgi:hypothetical protein
VGTAYERGASAPLSFGHWNEFFSSSLLNIELSLRELAASAAEKLQLVYDTERKDLYVQDGADKLSVQCAARKGSTEPGLLFVDLFKVHKRRVRRTRMSEGHTNSLRGLTYDVPR